MSPRRSTPATSKPTLPNPTRPKCKPRKNQNSSSSKPTQSTLWNFVQKELLQTPTDDPATQQTDSNNSAPTASPPILQTPPAQHPTYTPNETQPQSMPTASHNEPWGDAWAYTQPHDVFRVLSKNINSINPYSSDMVAIATELLTNNSSVFLAQETNTPWKPAPLHAIQAQCRRVYRHSKLAVSFSKDSTKNTYQPGGMLTLALGKWASRIVLYSSDELLGRWSYLEFSGRHGMRLFVVSAYRVCNQEFDATTITATAQQTRLLLQQGFQQPDPKIQFITDLISQVQTWRAAGAEVLISMDANKNVDHPQSKIARIFRETDLLDLHHHRYPATPKPATHQSGSNPINIMLGSPLLSTALIHTWMLPFGNPHLIKGDHRLLGLDFCLDILFGGQTVHPANGLIQGINSHNELQVPKYCKTVIQHCNNQRLDEQIATLLAKTQLLPDDIHKLEAIDTSLTKILVQTDQQCRPLHEAPWSPAVKNTYLVHQYWSLKLTAKHTRRDLSATFAAIKQWLEPQQLQRQPGSTLSSTLQKAQQTLKQVKREADKL